MNRFGEEEGKSPTDNEPLFERAADSPVYQSVVVNPDAGKEVETIMAQEEANRVSILTRVK